MNENAGKNDQNSSNDNNDDQGNATKNKCEILVRFFQNISLSFKNVEGMSEEKIA